MSDRFRNIEIQETAWTVWKYKLELDGRVEIEMPTGAAILHAGVYKGQSYLWCLVLPDAELATRVFRIYQTGHPIEEEIIKLKYIDTIQVGDASLVCHVFEVK